MSRSLRCLSLIALSVLLLGGPGSSLAWAQPSRTLVIQDGRVYLDGERVPESQWPPSLDVRNLNVQYSFSGIAEPVVELNGALYAIGDSLTPVDPDAVSARRSTVFLQGAAARAEGAEARAEAQLQQYQTQYLQEMQRRHKQLYERLMRERRMEAETYGLARTIQQLPDGPERQQYRDSLQTTLNQIFELKQENRRREIAQLEDQLEELQRRLEKREQMREQMIEQRIQQLIGGGR